jgi:RNA-directed DNA polymerase
VKLKAFYALDIKDFFNNIHESIVKKIFLNFFHYDESVSNALTNICCSNSHVIQGALTSSYIASICLHDIEGKYVTRLRNKGLNYTRLVDDITVSSKINNYDFDFAINLITEMLSEKDLPVNLAKTRIQHVTETPLIVHGLRVSFKEPRLPSDEVRKIRASVQNTETLSKERNYRTSHAYRRDFNRCMGRVNKLKRVGHNQHSALLRRLLKILPLPSKKDIARAETIIGKLKKDYPSKSKDNFWYKKRFYLAHERLNILMRRYPEEATLMRKELKGLKPEWA